jgi:hypothetical protein
MLRWRWHAPAPMSLRVHKLMRGSSHQLQDCRKSLQPNREVGRRCTAICLFFLYRCSTTPVPCLAEAYEFRDSTSTADREQTRAGDVLMTILRTGTKLLPGSQMPGATILGLGLDERPRISPRNISRRRSVARISAECAMNREDGVRAREHRSEFKSSGWSRDSGTGTGTHRKGGVTVWKRMQSPSVHILRHHLTSS